MLSRKTLIQSLSDFILTLSGNSWNDLARIASYLRRVMTKHCVKIHAKSDSAIESVVSWMVEFQLKYYYYTGRKIHESHAGRFS